MKTVFALALAFLIATTTFGAAQICQSAQTYISAVIAGSAGVTAVTLNLQQLAVYALTELAPPAYVEYDSVVIVHNAASAQVLVINAGCIVAHSTGVLPWQIVATELGLVAA